MMPSSFFKITLLLILAPLAVQAQNRDPLKTEIVTKDIDNFWVAFDAAKPDFKAEPFEKLYINKGTKGVDGFMKRRIQNAENLAAVVKACQKYYGSLRPSLDSISGMKDRIIQSLVKLKDLYPKAVFPPVYFVIGVLSSGGTSSGAGLIIGAEMYGLSPRAPTEELNAWQKTVIKPVGDVPHIVAHELIHFQQKYDGGSLLAASIKEGGADFLAELISGKHINAHVHAFADPIEKELWLEFKGRMLKSDYQGWLYSADKGRPNDLGYWMGYKITKAYYDKMPDKKQAVADILNIRDFEKFLSQSGYAEKFK